MMPPVPSIFKIDNWFHQAAGFSNLAFKGTLFIQKVSDPPYLYCLKTNR